MEGSNYAENVQPVRARKKGRKTRRERERAVVIQDKTNLVQWDSSRKCPNQAFLLQDISEEDSTAEMTILWLVVSAI